MDNLTNEPGSGHPAGTVDPPDLWAIQDNLDDLIEWGLLQRDRLPPAADTELRALAFLVAEARALAKSVSGMRAFYRVGPRDV